jgi:hypothetical protein
VLDHPPGRRVTVSDDVVPSRRVRTDVSDSTKVEGRGRHKGGVKHVEQQSACSQHLSLPAAAASCRLGPCTDLKDKICRWTFASKGSLVADFSQATGKFVTLRM